MTQDARWILDPNDPTQWRWWNGTQWTEHVAPLEAGSAAGTTGDVQETVGFVDQSSGTGDEEAVPASSQRSFPPHGSSGPWTARPAAAANDTEQPSAGSNGPTPGDGGNPRPGIGASFVAPVGWQRAIARLFALLGCLMAFGAGARMALLESVAGNTVAESFYNALGWAIMGAVFCFAASFSLKERDRERAERQAA
jgi:hypothetical protein